VVHAMVSAHNAEMSKIEIKGNRSGGAGASLGLSKTDKIAQIKALNDARFEYWVTPFYRYDLAGDGSKTLFDPFYGAALGAGLRFANNITMSVTFKDLNVLAVGESYDIPTKKELIATGASLFGIDDEGSISVIHNVTTYQGTSLILNLPSMLRTADFITLDSCAKIKAYIKGLTKAPDEYVIKTTMNYILQTLLPGYVSQGYLSADPVNKTPAFSNVTFALGGDRFDYGFKGTIPAPLHFVFSTQEFVSMGSAN